MHYTHRRPLTRCILSAPRAEAAGVQLIRIEIDLESSPDNPAFWLLSDDERDHASRFLRSGDALRYLSTRLALREILGERLRIPVRSLRFERDSNGRPRLARDPHGSVCGAIDFNVSHAGRHSLIAICEGRRVGVDIEYADRVDDWSTLASAVFAPRDQEQIELLPECRRSSVFYHVWTAKEAFLKAVGSGLSAGMTHFSVLSRSDGDPVAIPAVYNSHSCPRQGDCVSAFDATWCPVPAGYVACIAWSRRIISRPASHTY